MPPNNAMIGVGIVLRPQYLQQNRSRWRILAALLGGMEGRGAMTRAGYAMASSAAAPEAHPSLNRARIAASIWLG